MPLPFLEVFPREIRDQIYTYVLASPSGAVTLSPWTVEIARSLSLLRTCKQIHRECKDIIWYHNRLDIRQPTHLHRKFLTLSKQRPARRIRQLKVCLELLDRDELEWVASAAAGLEEWCRVGRLESITLSTEWDKPRGIEEFKEILSLRKYGECLDGRLYQESSTWTRMVINTGWPRFSHWGKQRWLKEMLLDPSGLNELLGSIHGAFGGQLYVGGKLCFDNRVRVVEDLKLDPRNGEIRIVPKFQSTQNNSNHSRY
ncbi:uncharacterized protein LY89DRAFT_648257 [Mollisia scopiformis]|uniref:F-box domain-containing protein n=1 Tax=Mollisia scopiformis TaxID=149040 RepID=A0A194X7E6_MOLSC|nr:uncharacterized protein LY89DRAFT_648257 [Mollisia scopiformis]KUJ16100.1 hypothetical protein LY89DRAFT_648257 [Mollisia scopiformis]